MRTYAVEIPGGFNLSHASNVRHSVTTLDFLKAKKGGKKISMVTCYDSAFGRLIENSPIDSVLVGDSLGNVMLGHASTIPVTISDMVHHCAAVSRVVKRPLLIADMPFMTYATVEDALSNATKLVQQGGAAAVKLEGGAAICAQVRALVESGIPVVGHLGLTPQSVHALGGYRVQAKTKDAQDRLIQDAKLLQEAGVFAVVLEMVPAELAAKVSQMLEVPTIGIGAGSSCDGQVLVLHDLLGFDSSFNPKFLKKYADFGTIVGEALRCYDSEVKKGQYPDLDHSF